RQWAHAPAQTGSKKWGAVFQSRQRRSSPVQVADLVEGAGEDADARFILASAVRLGPNTVELVFHRSAREVTQSFVGVCCRAGQHEAEWMKQPRTYFCAREIVLGGQTQGLPNIAQQHVGPLYVIQRCVKSLRHRFFHQALAQANAKIAGDDLDD